MKLTQLGLALFGAMLIASTASAAFLLEVDTDGLDDGILTFNSGFALGANTIAVSQSIAASTFGLTGGDSVFGGNTPDDPNDPLDGGPDTYLYTHSPDSQADNLATTPHTDLGEGNTASGRTGGGTGSYDVYATWPFTGNVSGGLTTYSVSTAGDAFNAVINQNDANDLFGAAGRGHVWVLLGSINYTSGSIDITQTPTANTFVSMRSSGVLFERTVPEPTSLVLAAMAGFAVICSARRR